MSQVIIGNSSIMQGGADPSNFGGTREYEEKR